VDRRDFLNRRPLGEHGVLSLSRVVRGLTASVALAALVALAGCETDGLNSGKAMKELSAEMKAEMAAKNMPLESPILSVLWRTLPRL